MDVGGRLVNAGIVLVVTVVVCGVGWAISIGWYELGLWPLGALTRIGVWLFGLFGLYWIVHHLRGSPRERLERHMREQGSARLRAWVASHQSDRDRHTRLGAYVTRA